MAVAERFVMPLEQAKELLDDPLSNIRLARRNERVCLSPRYLGRIKEGVRKKLDQKLNRYSQKLEGVVIAYDNLKLCQHEGIVIDDQPFLHFYVRVDWILFSPKLKEITKGTVNKIGKDYFGCLVHKKFNASIFKAAKDQWPSGLKIGSTLMFEVTKLHTNSKIFSMRGCLKKDWWFCY